MKSMICVTVAVVFVGVGQLRAENLLINGSFETYAVPVMYWDYHYQFDFNIATDSLDGWTVTGQIDIANTSAWQTHDGNNSLDLCGTSGHGGVSQTFSTVPGSEYEVQFFLSGNPNPDGPSEPDNKTLSVTAAGESASFSFDIAAEANTYTDMKWKECIFNFTANSTSTTLTINSTMYGNYFYGPVIDDVSVTSVPEPSSFAILVMGAICVGSIAKKTRNRGDRRKSAGRHC